VAQYWSETVAQFVCEINRQLIGINLVLGYVTIAVASLGRLIG